MLESYWSQFKSGTDIRGIASEGVPGEEVNLTENVVKSFAFGFLLLLRDKTEKNIKDLRVSVGRDSRISGQKLILAITKALFEVGVNVMDCGLSSTPAMFMSTIDLDCDGAIQITASHHPFNRNGLKFFTKSGGLESSDITRILQYAQDGSRPAKIKNGGVKQVNYINDYSARLKKMICEEVNADEYEKPLKGFKIIVDAGNGAGGFYANQVLAPLGADTSGSQFLEPDGMFPNHVPNPEDPAAMKSICEAVKKNEADMGVIFDTDVDRGGAVDSKGKEINRNRLIALASVIALEGNKGGTIVTDSVTSSGLKEFIEKDLGGIHNRFKRGYKNVINEALRLNAEGVNAPLAIETSGHAAMRDNYFLDDGAYLCTKLIIKMAQLKKEGKTLESLIENLKEPVEAKEYRYKIEEKNFREYGEKVLEDLEQYANENGWNVLNDSKEGVRVSFGDGEGNGWFLLRLSVHDPLMPLNIESDVEGGLEIIQKKIEEFIKTKTTLTL